MTDLSELELKNRNKNEITIFAVMIAIIDSGSTKTQWCFLGHNEEVKNVETIGLNPYFVDKKDVELCLEKEVNPFIDSSKVDHVYFFGSGCADGYKRLTIQEPIEDFFSCATVEVESDLLGASIALFGKAPGVVAIIGTGSSACYYDGTKIAEQRASLGYILGDEGSGANIGTLLLKEFLSEQMPEHLRLDFKALVPASTAETLDKVYRSQNPNRFLGKLAIFAATHIEDVYIKEIIKGAFRLFFEKQVLKIKNIDGAKIKMTGTLAYNLQSVIEEVAGEMGLNISGVEASPMPGLVKYYSEHKNINI